MDTVLVVINILLLIGFILLFLNRKPSKNEDPQMLMLNQRMDSLIRDLTGGMQTVRKEMQDTLLQTNKGLSERLDNAARVVGGVENKLGKLEEVTKKIFDVGKDISSLQEILRSPKIRGTMGELFLNDLLSQVLPKEHYQLQYGFKSGEKVDAVVTLQDNLMVPIDAKFPLENFKRVMEAKTDEERITTKKGFVRDIKKHIDDIAKKYILPDEGTLDFALMYIPAENVYYETVIRDEEETGLSAYAFSKRVIPVSPNNFYVYLQTVLMGMKGMQVEKNAREILANLKRLTSDFGKFKEDYELVGKHLGNAKSKFEDSERRLDKFEDKLIQSGQGEEQQKLLD